jgi:hypothetical protein
MKMLAQFLGDVCHVLVVETGKIFDDIGLFIITIMTLPLFFERAQATWQLAIDLMRALSSFAGLSLVLIGFATPGLVLRLGFNGLTFSFQLLGNTALAHVMGVVLAMNLAIKVFIAVIVIRASVLQMLTLLVVLLLPIVVGLGSRGLHSNSSEVLMHSMKSTIS